MPENTYSIALKKRSLMPGRNYDFWLLDLDGTVVDVEQSYVQEVLEQIGGRLDYAFSEAEANLLWYDNDEVRGEILSSAGVDAERFWAVYHEVEDAESRADATFVYDDAEAFVPHLEEPVGLVTHCQEYITRRVLETLDIADWFDIMVCCSEETGWKPDPAPVEAAMAGLGVANTGHVGALAGDNPQDVEAARNAGIDGIHVARPHRDWTGDPLGDRSVTSFADLNGNSPADFPER